MLPKTLKSCPKSNKLPDLVTLVLTKDNTHLLFPDAATMPTTHFNKSLTYYKSAHTLLFWLVHTDHAHIKHGQLENYLSYCINACILCRSERALRHEGSKCSFFYFISYSTELFFERMGHSRPLFCLFSSFQTNITILTTNKCEKMFIQYPVLGFKLSTF